MKATQSYLNNAILPPLGHLRVGSVVRADIARFFHEYSRRKAARTAVMTYCATCSIAPSRAAIVPMPPGTRARESTAIAVFRACGCSVRTIWLVRLGALLRPCEGENPICVATVGLLLLTGCRPGEIRWLRWCDVKSDRLTLSDATTGPRHALLGEAARELLDGFAGTASDEWMGIPRLHTGPATLSVDDLWKFWIKARAAAGFVADARLHDLRHGHASHAVMNGDSLHVAGRLFGHRRAGATNRYVHLDDATLSEAAERVALVIEGKLHPISHTAAKRKV